MTPLPPHPARWTRGTLTLFPARDGSGHEGVLTLDGVTIHIRAWRKVSGHVEFEGQHAADAEYEAMAAGLGGRVDG